MLTTIRRLHRVLVDRLAETSWLRDRAGAKAPWAHYERHAGARRRAAGWHATARRRAAERHARGRARASAGQAPQQRPVRVASRYQAAIGRIVARRSR
jgi:hypothetical protein